MYWVDVTGAGVAGYNVDVVVLQLVSAKFAVHCMGTWIKFSYTVLAGGAGAVVVLVCVVVITCVAVAVLQDNIRKC